MRVLIINKFLYPNGGSETYIFKLGEALEQHGHEVQYFGMEHEGRCVGNRVNAYLKKKIEKLWDDKKLRAEYSANCKDISFDTIDEYYEKIMKVYR